MGDGPIRKAGGQRTITAGAGPVRVRGKGSFLVAFIFACLLFWWAPTLLLRFVAHMQDDVNTGTIAMSVFALILFCAGYLLPSQANRRHLFSERTLDQCEAFAFRGTILGAVAALIVAGSYAYSRIGIPYGIGEGIPTSYQTILYAHLFLGLIYQGTARPEKDGWKRIWICSIVIAFPRLLISLNGGRFFLAQAVVPIALIALARGWLVLSLKRVLYLSVCTLALVFLPAITRGDSSLYQRDFVAFFKDGSTLQLFQDNLDLDLTGRCPPLAISLTAKIVPYHALGICGIDVWGRTGVAATLDRILTYNDPMNFGLLTGPGSNFLLELYVTGGLFAVFSGSLIFGFICGRFVGLLNRRSIFAGMWAECLTRALLAPRGNLGYVFEIIPPLVFTISLLAFVLWLWHLIAQEQELSLTVHGKVPFRA